jgi:hypothetical protein
VPAPSVPRAELVLNQASDRLIILAETSVRDLARDTTQIDPSLDS